MSKVLIIGAQNIDIFAKTTKEYTLKDSNIGSIIISYGGVGRNICENLKRLGNDVSFLTVFGDDQFSQQAKESLHKMNIDISSSRLVPNSSNSIYLGIMDKDNDLYLGINDMDITNKLDKEFLQSKLHYINSFDYIVIDNNLSYEAIEYLLKNITAPVIMDAVSAKKVTKLRPVLKYIDVLKVNTIELNELIKEGTIKEKINTIRKTGLKNLIITDGEEEITLSNQKEYRTMPLYLKEVTNASGAGDAFLSGFVHGMINNETDINKIEYAKSCAYHTLKCDTATSKELTKDVLK